jgi:hypothetical protein
MDKLAKLAGIESRLAKIEDRIASDGLAKAVEAGIRKGVELGVARATAGIARTSQVEALRKRVARIEEQVNPGTARRGERRDDGSR